MTTRRVAQKESPKSKVLPPPILFDVHDLGGIRELQVPCFPGVTELSGRNGAGKTSAINAIARASGGDVDVEVRDGAEQGSVTGNGVALTIRRIAKSTGSAEIELADGGPLADLIDGGGHKDADARARARVRALLRLQALPVDEQTIGVLASDPEVSRLALRECEDLMIDDLLQAAEKVRRSAHSLARVQEQRQTEQGAIADVHDGSRAAALALIGGNLDDLVDVPADAALANLRAAEGRLAVIRADAQRRSDLEDQQAEIRATLGDRPDPKRFDEAVVELDESVRMFQGQIADLETQKREIESKIARAASGLATAKRDVAALRQRTVEAQEEAQAWDRRAGVLARPIEGPVQADVEAQERAVEAATFTADRATQSAAYRAASEAARTAREAAGDAATRAEYLRTIATTVQDRLGQLLSKTAAQGLTVNADGRLCVVEGKRLLDFETRQSEGQRIAVALSIAARTYAGKVVPLDGRYWQALDPTKKAEFAAKAAELGLFVITERPTDGDLRVNHLPAAEAVAS
jgi:hypothetical protein